MTAPMFPTDPGAWIVDGSVDPVLSERLERTFAVASLRSVLERPGGFAPEERAAVASVMRAQAMDARAGRLAPPAEDAFAPHQFSPALADPDACERIAQAIEAGHVESPEIADAVLAFSRAVAATDVLRESIRTGSLRAALGDALISDATLTEFDGVGLVPPGVVQKTPSRAQIVREAHAAAVKKATLARDSISPYVGDAEMSGRTFSVEVEGFLYGGEPLDLQAKRARRELNAAGLPDWGVGTDNTVVDDARHERTGLEIRSPVLRGDTGLAECIRAVQALERAGFVTNDSCGLHVHVGVTGESLAQLKTMAATLTAQEPSLDAFTTPARRGRENRYAMPAGVAREYFGVSEKGETLLGESDNVSPADLGAQLVAAKTFTGVLDTLNVNGDEARFHKINYRSLMKRGTVEFRGRDSYLANPQELSDYVRLCDLMVDRAIKGECVLPVRAERFAAFAGAITLARSISHPKEGQGVARVGDSCTVPISPNATIRVGDTAEVMLPPGLVLVDDDGEAEEIEHRRPAGF
ncbi:MAG: amidoligase family protein [Gemmatimonadaceae bacterium]